MTDILVNWLNDELSVSSPVEKSSFARQFSSGFLIGEVLKKYQLQDDFDQFSQSKTADSKLNNFTRIEPVLHLLGIPFDTNLARDIMTERHGVATRLMYQLYIALTNKKKAQLTGVAMETMRPAAPAKLNAVETEIYKQRLKHVTPRQTDLNLEALGTRFHEKQIEMEKTAFKERFREQERILKEQQAQRQALLERSRQLKSKQSELVAKIQAATVEIPKPPANRSAHAIEMRKSSRRRKEAQEAMTAIAMFEEKMKTVLPPSKLDEDSGESFDMAYLVSRDDDKLQIDPIELIKPASNDDYIGKIKKRLHEDSTARQEREKRRRKVLVDQMKAHYSQEEAHREEMMVNRLMRQSQQERRIAVQLLQARHEKEVIRRNRIIREKQYEERRLRDFEDALDKEAELARLAKLEYMEQTKKDQELHDKIAAERAEARYKKHYDSCGEVVNQIVDFASKVAEYRELTNLHLPPKLMREWTALFVAGHPLFEPGTGEGQEPTPEQILEEERQQLLDEGDFMEYKNMTGEWQPPDVTEPANPPKDNPVLGHVIQRLFNIVHPPSPPPPPPEFPPFPIRACILGKVFSGKTTCVTQLAADHRLQVLIVDELVDQAVEAHKAGEIIELPVEEELEEKADDTPRNQSQLGGTGDPATTSATSMDNTTQEAPPPQTQGGIQPESAADVTASDKIEPTPETQERQGETSVSGSTSDLGKPASKSSSRDQKDASPQKPQPSDRARLGAKALKYLKKGKPVDDQIIVDVLVESIRRVPEGTGWAIDGFPQTYNQAKMLEKALSGFDATAKEHKEKSKDKRSHSKSGLVPDPRPPPPPPEPTSGIDVVIHFEVPDELCMKRAAGRYYAVQADEQYHHEFKPPPEGSATGVGKQEQVIPIQDTSHDQEQIQQRITGFHDSWPKLEKWFTRFGTLKKVDASQEQDTVFLEVEKILEDTVNKLLGKDQESSAPVETEPVVEEKPPEPVPEPVPEPPKEPEVPPETKGSRSSSKGSRSGSAKKSGSRSSSKDKDKREKSVSPKRGASPKKDSKKGSRGSSPKSPKRGRSGKKAKTPEPEPEPEPEVPTGPPPPQPGSEEWEFVDQNIEQDLAEVLANHWEAVEKGYVHNSKHVFRNIRDEREKIYRYFYEIRKDYLAYLRRPDHKQEFVKDWQKEYNSVSDDMRDDDETRSELHQTVDDLRERLWNICDERKEQAEKERETIISDGWLEDRLGVLSNHYITLMQSEVDRFQDTVRMLKDYYRGMDGQIPDELKTHYARIPLVELPVVRPETPEGGGETEPTPTPPAQTDPPKSPKDRAKSPKSPRDRSKSPKESRSKSPKDGTKSPKDSGRAKSRTPSGKKRSKSQEKEKEKDKAQEIAQPERDGPRKRIPLVPFRPVSPDPDAKPGTTQGKDKKDKKGGKRGDDIPGMESPVPPTDLDEKLIFDGALTGIIAIAQIMAQEHAAREAEEEAERQREQEKEREREREKAKTQVKKGGKKGGKSRSPSPKKKKEADTAPTPPPPTEEESEEEKQKKLVRDRMRQEYYFAIGEEEKASRVRVELIKVLGMAILQDLKGKADNAYKDMNDWLGARYLKEMESIDHMSEIMRFSIENGEKIKSELILKQEDFLLDEDKIVLRSPTPPQQPQLVEQPIPDQFTVDQLMGLFQQFTATAPTGVMSNKSFCDTFENIVAVTYGMEQLPDVWMNVTPGQIQEFANILASNTEYVDWRRFLLALTSPVPTPTQAQLLESLARLKEMDQKDTGFVTREQYDRTDLWFSTEDSSTPGESYCRLTNLKKVMFDIFANFNKTPPVLDYTSMLMYFSAVPNSHEGFLRALSVAAGTHMPRLEKPVIATTTTPAHPDRLKSIDDSLALATPEIDEKDEKVLEPPMTGEEIPAEALEAKVPVEALYKVLHHGESSSGDSHRFSVSADPEDATSMERLSLVYRELESEDVEPVPYRILIEHPLIQDIVTACKTFKLLDVKGILSTPSHDMDLHSIKTMD